MFPGSGFFGWSDGEIRGDRVARSKFMPERYKTWRGAEVELRPKSIASSPGQTCCDWVTRGAGCADGKGACREGQVPDSLTSRTHCMSNWLCVWLLVSLLFVL